MKDEMDQAEEPLRKLTEVMIHSLVDDRHHAVVTTTKGEQTLCINVSVRKSDLGKVIGRLGQNIQSIRQIVLCASSKYGVRAVILLDE